MSDRDRGTTHWEGCWRSHPRCAEARVEKLEARVESYREEVEEARVVAARAHAYLCEEKDWHGATSILTEVPLIEVVSVKIRESGVSPAYAAEANEIAHRALNDGEDDESV